MTRNAIRYFIGGGKTILILRPIKAEGETQFEFQFTLILATRITQMRNLFLFLLAKIDSIGVLIAKEMDIQPHSAVYHQLYRSRGVCQFGCYYEKPRGCFPNPSDNKWDWELGRWEMGNGEWVLRSGWAEAMTGHLGSGGGTEQLENAKQTELEKMEMAKEGGEGAIGGNKILTQPDSSSRFN